MASIYLCDLDHDPERNAWDPAFDGAFAVLMLDRAANACVLVSPDDDVTGPGVHRILSAPSWEDLRATAASTKANNTARKVVNDWLAAKGYPSLPSSVTSIGDIAEWVAHRVNGVASLAETEVNP